MNKIILVKSFLCIFISIALLFSLTGPGCVRSKDKFEIAKVDIFINGEKIETDVKPRVINDLVLLPAGEVLTALGADIAWHEESQMLEAFKDDICICMYADADYASVNHMIRMLEVPIQSIEGQLMVPYSFIAESLDFKVTVDVASDDIQIYTDSVFYDELPKNEIDFSVSASDIHFHERHASKSGFVRPGVTIKTRFKIFKGPGDASGGGKAKLVFDGFHIDTIPFFMDRHNSSIQINRDYVIPLDRYLGLAPDETKNAVFSVEIIPDYLSTDTNLSNNKAEISLDIKGIERKTNEVASSYTLDSILARFKLTHNLARPGSYLALLSYIKGTGSKTIISHYVNGEIVNENFMISRSAEKATQHSYNYYVPHDYVGLINYSAQLDNGDYRFLPVSVAPFEFVAFPGCIGWNPHSAILNYNQGENLQLSAVILRENKNPFSGALRAYFLINGQLSPPLKVQSRSGAIPYLGDVSYIYRVPQDAPDTLEVKILVDPGELYYEHNKSNNIASLLIPRQKEGGSGNDISINDQDLRIAPSYIVPGDSIQLIATIKNNSKDYPDKEVRIIFKINGEIIGGGDFTRPKNYFRPGQGYTVSKMWKVPDELRGDIIFTVEIDPEGKLTGDNRSDNNASTETAVAKPDLSIEEKSLMSIARLISGSHGTLKARINNFGPVEAENVHVAFYINGEEVGRNIIDVMPAFSSFDIFTGFTVPTFASQEDKSSMEGVTGYKNPAIETQSISYSAVIDPLNLVEESNEDNNSAGPKELDVYVPATKGTVHIIVRDLNNQVIENVEVVLSEQNESASAQTDSSGQCTFLHVPYGSFEAIASKSGYKTAVTMEQYLYPGNISQYVRLYLDDRSYITGYVSSTTGAKLQGVKISASQSNEQIRTNSEGWYEIRLAAGTYTIKYVKAGYRPETMTLPVGAGQDISQDIVMETTNKAYISGSAYDENGALLKNFHIKVVDSSNNVLATTNTDLNGNYSTEVSLSVHETWIAVQATHNKKSYSGPVYALRGMEYWVDVSFMPVYEEELLSGQSSISGKVTPYVVCAQMPGTFFNPGYKVEAIYGAFQLDLLTMIEDSHMMYVDISVVPDYWILTDVAGTWNPSGLLAIGSGLLAEKVICAILPLNVNLNVSGHSLNKTKTWIKKIAIISDGVELYTSYPDRVDKYECNPNLAVNLNDCIVKLYLQVGPAGTGLNPAAGWGMDRVLVVWNPGNKKFEKIGQYTVIKRDGYLDGIYMDY